jgi:hypothetical protein
MKKPASQEREKSATQEGKTIKPKPPTTKARSEHGRQPKQTNLSQFFKK